MRKFFLMALAAIGIALAAPTGASAAPVMPADALRAIIDQTSGVENVAHCRYSSYYGCRYYRRYRVYRVYRYRPRYRVYRFYRW